MKKLRQIEYLKTFWMDDHYYVTGGVRKKGSLRPVGMRKSSLFKLVALGHVVIEKGGKIKITKNGFDFITPEYVKNKRVSDREYHKAYRAGKADAGFLIRQVWIHKDDLDAFNEFMLGMKYE